MTKNSQTSPSLPHPTRTILIVLLTLSVLSVAVFPPNTKVLAYAGTTYYVDCNGSNNNSGKSPTQAWRSLDKANMAPLVPGDSLLLKRGCTWPGTLKASWNGTEAQPILIGAYGSGARPKIQNGPNDLNDGYHNNVDITGSFLTIQYIETVINNPPVKSGCNNNPIGFFIGFNFRNPDNLANGGSYNLLRYSKASGHTAGAHLTSNTHHNRIMKNTFIENRAMESLTPTSVGTTDDIGAWGMVLKGSNQEVGYNYFSNNNALCTYDTNPQGNSIEIYEARDNVIHHNVSVNDRVFSELGGSPAIRSDNNSFVYNLVISNILDARFVVARGSGNGFGPTYRTKVFHNTVYYTGAESEGIVCGAGCNGDILTMKNNIIWAEQKAAYADGAINESHNIYWNSSGAPFVQFQSISMSNTSKITNPGFVDPAAKNFHLKSTSPAIDAGMNIGWGRDLDNTSIPQGANYDIGSYEYSNSGTVATTGLPISDDHFQLYLSVIED